MIEYFPLKNSGISSEEWDSFIDSADNGTMFHKRLFLSYHPKERFEDASLVVKKENQLLSFLTTNDASSNLSFCGMKEINAWESSTLSAESIKESSSSEEIPEFFNGKYSIILY